MEENEIEEIEITSHDETYEISRLEVLLLKKCEHSQRRRIA